MKSGRKTKARKTKRCKHVATWVMELDGVMNAYRECLKCNAKGVVGVGPANDADLNVQREISAAEIIQDKEYAARTEGWVAPPLPPAENYGFMALDLTPYEDSPGWHIGWCAAEALYDRSDGWPWDPGRPVAGQFEEWQEVLRSAESDDGGGYNDDDQPDPATEFGEQARQVTVPVDRFDDEAFDVSDAPDEVAR